MRDAVGPGDRNCGNGLALRSHDPGRALGPMKHSRVSEVGAAPELQLRRPARNGRRRRRGVLFDMPEVVATAAPLLIEAGPL